LNVPPSPPPGPGAPIPGQAETAQQYPPQQPYYQEGGGPGLQDRAAHAADVVARHVKTPETKEFYKTSEFLIWLVSCLGILIAAASIGGDNGDAFNGDQAWTLVAIVSGAYILSRGLSKAGTRRGYGDAPMDRGYTR
jgi:hypothetical protein